MELITTINELKSKLKNVRVQNKTIGFVPTMGALHSGHFSLIKQCIRDNDYSIVSIFVNPTQFNNLDDLKNYPRVLDRDRKALAELGVTIMFTPTESEIYPEPDQRTFDFGQLDKVMEGIYRPGHFNGVAQVVSRLFDIVNPTRAYFGEKDFQQLAIIKSMVKQLNLSVQIIPMPIAREKSGLALSSRNELLRPEEKENAANISKILTESRTWINKISIQETIEKVNTFLRNKGLLTEYFDIVDADTLQSLKSWDESKHIIGCIAVFCGKVRLIDNIIYK